MWKKRGSRFPGPTVFDKRDDPPFLICINQWWDCVEPHPTTTSKLLFVTRRSPRPLEANPLMKLFRLDEEWTSRPVRTIEKKGIFSPFFETSPLSCTESILFHRVASGAIGRNAVECLELAIVPDSAKFQMPVFWTADGGAAELQQECTEATDCVPFVRREILKSC